MSEVEGLPGRLRWIQSVVGGSRELERLSGVTLSQQSRMIRGEILNPGVLSFFALAKAANVSLNWLLTGSGDQYDTLSNQKRVHVAKFSESVPDVFFSVEYARDISANIGQCLLYQHKGDSMSPLVNHLDLVIVDPSDKSDGLCLVTASDSPYLFHVQNSHDGVIKCLVENRLFNDPEFNKEIFTVVGRVIWRGGCGS